MISSVCIVGGGTAGWMTAAYLAKTTNLKIRLIESEALPIIGVGESTVPSFCDFLKIVEITEEELFSKIGSIRKYTANHTDWNYKNHSWWHHFVFNNEEIKEQINWMKNYILPDKKWRHSYHIDGNKFAILLRDKMFGHSSIEHTYDKVIEVIESNDGIKAVKGERGTYTADFFIDCSGFKQILISRYNLKKENNKNLINNKAWACHADYSGNKPLPYTKTIAMDAGWQWNICLLDRVGAGYVFCDKFISPDQAKEEFINKCPYKIRLESLKLINFISEWSSIVWYKNVLALGLSAGFLEPLESQSIFLTQMQIQMFSRLYNKPKNVKIYNKFWNIMVRHLAEYLEIHYTLSKRDDTNYWKSFPKINYAKYNHTYSPLFHNYSYSAINEAYTSLDRI